VKGVPDNAIFRSVIVHFFILQKITQTPRIYTLFLNSLQKNRFFFLGVNWHILIYPALVLFEQSKIHTKLNINLIGKVQNSTMI
jgi:hypothetical protein